MARIARVLNGAMAAARGDPQAVDYLHREAWRDALEAWRPGIGRAIEVAFAVLGGALENEPVGPVDVRPAEGPWSAFVARLRRQPWGAHVVLGPPGSGKTSLALKLAWVWREELGYDVDVVNMYAEDRPSFARTITSETLLSRMNRLRAWLEAEAEPDPGEEAPGQDVEPPPTHRVIVVDEAHLGAGAGTDPVRVALRKALTQVRHVRWHLVYISQMAGLLPPSVLAQTVVWVKRPSGREVGADRQGLSRELWERAAEAFRDLERSPFYTGPYADPRAWAYVDAPDFGYCGLVPFTPYYLVGEAVEDDEERR